MDRANHLLQQLEQIEAELTQIFGTEFGNARTAAVASATNTKSNGERGGKRTMSPEGRARIAAATRARWARIKGEQNGAAATNASPVKAKKKRKTMSPEARARIAEAQKRRWAMQRSGK